MHQYTNKLINETSPYLLQHAHNPVNWYPWGDEALSLAKKDNKPILVSIGYSACHWCHVMERESFEDEETAKLMNGNFINIKIDREERPDLDHIYMDAVQAMMGSGGWPLNVFLTPDGKPFYGGTYFPPKRAFNRPSWNETLTGVSEAFNERRTEIDAQAENLTEHLLQSNSFGLLNKEDSNSFTEESLHQIFDQIMKNADKVWGGFGRAPKFPQTFTILFLLRYAYFFNNKEAKDQALVSIDKMIDGGLYDQVGGGFARYSTDTEWLVPHFEKMLYDNALLLSVISEAYQVTNNERYYEVLVETCDFLQREMQDKEGGYYSALDADSEGEEGKFYTWQFEEVKDLLKENSEIFCDFFDITPNGNWEAKNIPRIKWEKENYCKNKGINRDKLDEVVNSGKKQLLEKRNNRIRPGTDDKILLGWNALLNTAFCKVYAATGIEGYKKLAIDNTQFILSKFTSEKSSELFHTYKNGRATQPAFLDDYAYFIQSLIILQETTGNVDYLKKAHDYCDLVIKNFFDHNSYFFFYTSEKQTDVIIRKKEIYDGAVPSGNAIMAENLMRLGLYFDKKEWNEIAMKLTSSMSKATTKYPTSFGVWASLFMEYIIGTNEIAVLSVYPDEILYKLLKKYIPNKIVLVSNKKNDDLPLLKGKEMIGDTSIFLCRNYSCRRPVASIEELLTQIQPK